MLKIPFSGLKRFNCQDSLAAISNQASVKEAQEQFSESDAAEKVLGALTSGTSTVWFDRE